jgi:hypothetical protein
MVVERIDRSINQSNYLQLLVELGQLPGVGRRQLRLQRRVGRPPKFLAQVRVQRALRLCLDL